LQIVCIDLSNSTHNSCWHCEIYNIKKLHCGNRKYCT